MKKIQGLVWAIAIVLGIKAGLAQTSSDLDLSTRSAGVPPTHTTVDSVTKWIENPLDQKLQIVVTNLYANTNDYMEIVIGGQHVKFSGAGTDAFGNYIPTNYEPVTVNAVLRREYPMSIMCPNSGPNGSPLFKIGDLNPSSFLPVLTNSPTDAVSAFLWANFVADGKTALTNRSTTWEVQQTNLTLEINHILVGPSIYNSTRFAGVTLQTDTQQLLAQNPSGQPLVRLNRLLLRDAYSSSFYVPPGNPDSSGTAAIVFSVIPPPELKVKKNQPALGYSVSIKPDIGHSNVLNLQHPAGGNVSTNYSTVTVLKDKFGHFGLGDGCDDATKAPGQGSWLSMGPGCNQDTNRISLEWHVSLGRTFDGLAAGVLAFREPGLSRDSYTPYAIYYNGSMTNLYAQLPLGDVNNAFVPTNYYASVLLVTTNVPFVLTNSTGQVYTNFDTVIRQIKAYQTFVDISAPNTNQTVLNFYLASQVQTNQNQNGLYTNIMGSPFVTWTIQNPDPSTTTKLLIIENRQGNLSTNSLAKTNSGGVTTWTLTQGMGASTRVEKRDVSFVGSPATNRVEVDTIAYASSPSSPAYKCQETYHFYPWGSELVETRIPNNPDQVTTYDYYADRNETYGNNGYGQLKQIVYPDGYWEKRVYEDMGEGIFPGYTARLGTLDYILHPYLDSNGAHGEATGPSEATPYNATFTKFEYVLGYRAGYARDSLQVDGLNGMSPLGRMWESARYPGGSASLWPYAEGDGVETTDWTPWGSGGSETSTYGTWTYTYSDGAPIGLSGHTYEIQSFAGPSNPSRLFYYDQGIYNAATSLFVVDTNNHLFTAGGTPTNYPDFRQTELVYGLDNSESSSSYPAMEDHPLYLGLHSMRTRRNARIYQNGNLVQTEESIYLHGTDIGDYTLTDPQWALLSTMRYKADSLGRTTNVLRIDPVTGQSRTVYSADYRGSLGYDGPLLLSEIDETGEKTSYVYDGLQRPVTNILSGFGSQPDRVVQIIYDVNNQVLSKTVSAGTLTQVQTQSFDLAGRVTNAVDSSGIAVSTVFSADGRTQTSTYPGGITIVKDNYVDRRIKDVQGSGVVNKFYSYALYSNPLLNSQASGFYKNSLWPEQVVHMGSANSLRWRGTGKDSSGFDALDIWPVGGNSTNTAWTGKVFMNGNLLSILASTGYPGKYFNHDACGRTNVIQMSLGGAGWWQGTDDPESDFQYIFRDQSRVAISMSYPVLINGAWYEGTTNYFCLTDGASDTAMSSIHLEQLSGFNGSEFARTIDYDADTNQTTTVTYLDRSQNKITEVTTQPATSSLSATNVYQNGLPISSSTLSVASPTKYFYDALGRTNQIQ